MSVSTTPLPELPEVFETYYRKVRAWAASFVGRDEAEDVVQEVFVKIGRSLDTVADPAKLPSWVYTITLNTVRDAVRKRGRRPEEVSQGPGPADAEGGGETPALDRFQVPSRSPEEEAMRNEMVACYLDYVNQLPPRYLEVYALSELEGLSNEEIAGRLSLSVGTVKIRLHRARAQLGNKLRCECQPYRNERGELMGEPKRR